MSLFSNGLAFTPNDIYKEPSDNNRETTKEKGYEVENEAAVEGTKERHLRFGSTTTVSRLPDPVTIDFPFKESEYLFFSPNATLQQQINQIEAFIDRAVVHGALAEGEDTLLVLREYHDALTEYWARVVGVWATLEEARRFRDTMRVFEAHIVHFVFFSEVHDHHQEDDRPTGPVEEEVHREKSKLERFPPCLTDLFQLELYFMTWSSTAGLAPTTEVEQKEQAWRDVRQGLWEDLKESIPVDDTYYDLRDFTHAAERLLYEFTEFLAMEAVPTLLSSADLSGVLKTLVEWQQWLEEEWVTKEVLREKMESFIVMDSGVLGYRI